ncbi:amidase [Sphingomonas sp.]|uniref:amidase n=1 Tax=Sphingomonas sp. TaxID=28214 RepID=UPI002DBDBA3F|nr:amidase [Sphingomonas sp.]HEU4970206.1 amidase [Sphingomonas sp.]
MPIDWDHLETANAPLNAFVDWDHDAAPGEGPLAGLTIGIKSNIAVAGLPWTGGMALRRDIVADRDAAVVAGLRVAGACILGSLNMHEAAMGATTDNPWFGRTHNPHRIGYTPGGSSGGSGAAVAAGLCDAALGTDTLGSVRIPAAFTGVYGLKPSWGGVDTDGLVFLTRRFDCIGPLARTLDVLERVWNVIGTSGNEDAPFTRVLHLPDLGGVEVQPAVGAAYRRALDAIPLPREPLVLPAEPTTIRMAALVEIARELIEDIGADRTARADLISDELKFIMDTFERVEPKPELLERTRDTLLSALGANGALLMPTCPQAPFAHGRPPASQADFTGLANIAGLPALAIPAGLNEERLPVGVQLVGPQGSETRLIALARSLEPVLGGYTPPPAMEK